MIRNVYIPLKRCFFYFLIIFAVSIPVQAQEELNANPAIWRLDHNSASLYLLGSVHLLPDNINWYGGTIEQIVNDADEVVFEVHLTPEKEARSTQIVLANGIFQNGDTLSNYLEEEEYNTLMSLAQTYGFPGSAISTLKPWYASVVLSVNAIIKQGWNPNSGVDKSIEKIAATQGKLISELETVEFQMSTLYDHPLEVQAEMLKDTLVQLQDINAVTLEMVDAWASGDAERMNVAFLEPMKLQEEIYNKLVLQRNRNWIPVIENLINKDQVTLVVAGVAHFIGDDGIIGMLEEKGYKVTRMQ
jgi:uncharacterized protein YbaP (TraB family)